VAIEARVQADHMLMTATELLALSGLPPLSPTRLERISRSRDHHETPSGSSDSIDTIEFVAEILAKRKTNAIATCPRVAMLNFSAAQQSDEETEHDSFHSATSEQPIAD
jgi:hypothetical protein